MSGYFTPALFGFLRDLKKHNDRDWFEANRARYVSDVEGPLMSFITDLAPHLHAISPSITVSPRRMGGSLYRIHRDTRFSPDKSPYKTYVAARFAHAKRRTVKQVPGFYLHFEPGECFGGGGIYHPDPPTLARIRLAIVNDDRAWSVVKREGLVIEGERLKRAPAGFDPAHRFVEDLKLKDLYVLAPFSEEQVTAPDFLDRYVELCRNVAPLNAFLTRALGWKW